MTWAPLETQKTVFETLNEDAALATLLNRYTPANPPDPAIIDQFAFDFVPDNEEFPYIHFFFQPWAPRDNATYDGLEVELQIDVWYQPGANSNTGRGNKTVQLIQQRVDELLQHNQLCIDGWNSLQVRRTFIDVVTMDDNVTKQGIQRFKILLGEK